MMIIRVGIAIFRQKDVKFTLLEKKVENKLW